MVLGPVYHGIQPWLCLAYCLDMASISIGAGHAFPLRAQGSVLDPNPIHARSDIRWPAFAADPVEVHEARCIQVQIPRSEEDAWDRFCSSRNVLC